ncbi:MAG: PLP-dependent aminotransferase family protein [Clostridia bacterium]|nr:PLP-dependent aminotransferase family protein [Clostridia bacterium]
MRTSKPAYLTLYESLREEIISGVRPFGSRLPSRRELARERGVSAVTAEHSVELLCEEGYAEPRPRSGCYVVYRESDGFIQPSVRPDHRLPPASPATGRNTFPFPTLAKVMRRVLSEYGEEILVRPPHTGCKELREALSSYLARNRGIRVQPSQIVIGAGAEYLYGLVVELLGSGRVYGIESPSYQKIEQVYRSRGVRVESCPLGKDGILSGALQHTAASVLHITPFRSFPSGVTATASKRREYLRWADRPDRYLVEDDYESEFSLLRKPEETLFAGTVRQNVIYLNTFSRTVSPSFRVGYMVLPPALLPVFEARVGFYSCTVPAFEQYVLAELINGGEFERHINRIRRRERKSAEIG